MILKGEDIYRELTSPKDANDPLVITPMLDLEGIKNSGSASVDMRLGCWFLTFRQSRIGVFDVYDKHADIPSEAKLTKSHYVPFGVEFIKAS
jgi:hypothetical protein